MTEHEKILPDTPSPQTHVVGYGLFDETGRMIAWTDEKGFAQAKWNPDRVRPLYAGQLPQEQMTGAARAFMDLFVVDNGEERGLSVDDIDMAELTRRFAELEAALTTEGQS